MREGEKKRTQTNNIQPKKPTRTVRRDSKSNEVNGRKLSNGKDTKVKVSNVKSVSGSVASATNAVAEPPEVYENVVIHYVDDAYRSESPRQGSGGQEMAGEDKDNDLEDRFSDISIGIQQVKGEDSDFESVKDSASSQGDSQAGDDEKIERAPRKGSKKGSYDLPTRSSLGKNENEKKPNGKASTVPKKQVKSNKLKVATKGSSEDNNHSEARTYTPSESSEGNDDKLFEEANQELFDAASNGAKSVESDEETINTEYNASQRETGALKEKVEIMENRIGDLEEELRAVAALEISLYSVVPEHGSSAHKVHTPARRLSRLYIHACKHWTQSKRATIAKNTVSGLILVAKTCGNDVARLTFWLSNTVVLREIILQAFGISSQHSRARQSNGNGKLGSGGKPVKKTETLFEDWQETSTYTAALEKIEAWIFSRVVESVWWQAMTPNMLSPVEDLVGQKSLGKLLGPALGDQQQGTFAIELWENAFQSAFQRLCPVRAAGHECGCLPVLARMVMEQCAARLDVAMFNAILRESAHQIPTDPVSDPIVDSRVLPIPAGDWSFGSGAQLKNSVGHWSMWFSDSLGMDTDAFSKDHDSGSNDDNNQTTQAKTQSFGLLNELSELLMLPKDMILDKSIRGEVCPSIILSVIIRILCNFTPDEFCPDAVPGEVLEALNAENFVERKIAGESAGSFPYAAVPIVYTPPSSEDVSEKVAEAGGKPHIERNVSKVQTKGYTSDDELDDLDSPLTTLIEPSFPSTSRGNVSSKSGNLTSCGGNARYELLREVWSL